MLLVRNSHRAAGKVTLAVDMEPELRDEIRARAQRLGIPVEAYLEELITGEPAKMYSPTAASMVGAAQVGALLGGATTALKTDPPDVSTALSRIQSARVVVAENFARAQPAIERELDESSRVVRRGHEWAGTDRTR